MKRMLSLFCALAMVWTLSACGAAGAGDSLESPEDASAGELVRFTDDLGREVELSRPKRVAVLIGSFADIWCLAGGRETIVAASDNAWTDFDLNLPGDVARLGSTKDTNLENLIAAEPDLVLASSNTTANVELLETFERMGLPSAYFQVSTFDEYLRMLEICTRLTGHEENYDTYGRAVGARVEAAKARATGTNPTALYVRASGSSCKVKNSQDSVLGEMLADLGCVNIADSNTGLLENLSLETIVALDPDYIFVVLQGGDSSGAQAMFESTLLSNPAWNGLCAVQEGRYYTMDDHLYNLKPNARWGEAYEQLADILYPAS